MGRFVFTLGVGVWLGTLVSFSFIFLPAIHASAEGPDARRLLDRLFPRYYLTGIICGLVALGSIAAAPAGPGLTLGDRLRLGIPVAVALLCVMVGRQVLLPRLAQIRRDDQPDAYERMHRLAAMLNSTVLALLVLVLAAVTAK